MSIDAHQQIVILRSHLIIIETELESYNRTFTTDTDRAKMLRRMIPMLKKKCEDLEFDCLKNHGTRAEA